MNANECFDTSDPLGDRVAVLADLLVGTVRHIDARCASGVPCMCRGRGVSVEPDGAPNVRIGVAPGACIMLASGPAMVSRAIAA